jgi:ferredoxin, 2Fe-2S
MPKVIYISHDGQQTELEIATNNNLMLGAVYENVAGIEGMCGGCLACATCHVYIDPAWLNRLPSPSEDEETMLTQVAAERRPNSRLCCQIEMTEALDGLIVHTPAEQ